MKINDNAHGFKVIEVRDVADCKGTLYEMVHVKTDAKLIYLDREDDNKTFAITFKTLPSDDTGVFHMLEHSVLNGSKKYPVKEPFVELLKGSMQTFLNAITFSDKTMYPVSSRNDKDFMNLMSVYMDAVFHPAIYSNPNIFYQEGWHYEIRDPKDEPVYKGVVLNEMKGAFSSADEQIVDELNRMLFPDNCYQYNSGGDPEHIVDLSYDQFIETHQKYYHPSNARIFLDGTMDIEEVLKFIDEEYLSQYEKEEADFTIKNQTQRPAEIHHIAYEVTPGEDTAHRTQIAMAKIVSSFDNVKKNLAWQALTTILVGNNESPFKQAILDKDLGEDVELELFDGIQQPWAVLTVRNTDEENYEEVMQTLMDTAHALVENGLNHDQLTASINQMEFHYHEKHEPAGLMYAKSAIDTWLYDGDPLLGLELGPLFDALRNEIENGYFEELLKEFLCNDDLMTVIEVPSETKAAEREKEETERLHLAKEGWGEKIQDYIALNQALDIWQETPDSEENLETLPKLTLEDVNAEPIHYDYEEREIHGVPVILHQSQDNGVVYMSLYFSLAGITREYLPSVGFFSSLMMQLPTKNKTVEELQEAVRRDLGGLSFFVDAYSPRGVYDACVPVIGVNCSVLAKNTEKAISLILEVMQETVFDAEHILPLLKQDNNDFREMLKGNGHSIAMKRVSAHYSAEGVFREYVGGYASGYYEKKLEDHYEEEIGNFLNECEMYQEILFSRDRMTASITGEENLPVIKKIIGQVHTAEGMRAKMHYPFLEDPKECIRITSGVSYSAAGNNFYQLGKEYDAGMMVLAHIMTFDYLWTEVRVKGGAYGTGFSVNPNGNCGAYSYRDPDVMNAMHAYAGMGDAVKQISESGMDLSQMIIGAIASGEPLLAPSAKIHLANTLYFSNRTIEIRRENRKKMLSMTAEELGQYAEVLSQAMAQGAGCVVGNEEAVNQCMKEGYQELESIF